VTHSRSKRQGRREKATGIYVHQALDGKEQRKNGKKRLKRGVEVTYI